VFSSLDGQLYNVDSPDVINPQAGAQVALNYTNGSGGAAIQVAGAGGRGSVVMFGFPFETITTAANRAAVIDRVFDFFGLEAILPPNADFDGDGLVDAADYVVWRKYYGTSVPAGTLGDANRDSNVDDGDYTAWRVQFGGAPPAATAASASAAAEAMAIDMPQAADQRDDVTDAFDQGNGTRFAYRPSGLAPLRASSRINKSSATPGYDRNLVGAAVNVAVIDQHLADLRFLPMDPRLLTFSIYSGAKGTLQAVFPMSTVTTPTFLPVASAISVSDLM
jgi:hypothetical protein